MPNDTVGYVSPTTRRPLVLDRGRGVFATGDGTESFACVADSIPDFRVGEPPIIRMQG